MHSIVVNGEPRSAPEGTTVAQLLRGLALDPRTVAVERNREIVPRREFEGTVLTPGDRLEIVTFVGGG
jgi:thiamine biosynthesis protein ThiS